MGAIFSSAASCIIYRFIILPRKQSNERKISSSKQSSKTTTRQTDATNTSPYLIGFGIVMPLCALSPYYYLRYFGIKNKIIKFLAGVAQLTSFFRCSEGERRQSCIMHVCVFVWIISTKYSDNAQYCRTK